ncbi:DUF4249 family protein [Xanthovirga aplysinae]|uniref:DUF4249 family protein n=1 Tax=Xanthovirga aplysinae TaxID=2529853 RepID=UPI0012BB7213|nr:DUF4249 family protein [Xanthovirga aplysinae]
MKPFNRLYLIILLLACEPEPLFIDISTPENDHIVVSSNLYNNEQLIVLLTNSYDALESQPKDSEELIKQLSLDSILATIETRGQLDTLKHLSEGFYWHPQITLNDFQSFKLQIRDTLRNRFVTSESQILPKVTFDMAYPTIEEKFDTIVSIHYKFEDLKGTNWYMINVQKAISNFNNYNFSKTKVHTELIKDNDQSGKSIEGSFKVLNIKFSRKDTIVVSISNITENYFKYLELRNNEANWLVEPTQEPFNYPTNVIGGIGFFNLYYTDNKYFILKDH